MNAISRLGLAIALGSLLLLGLAYWWINNLFHEVAGVLMFIGIGWHISTQKRWFARMLQGRYSVRRSVVTSLHLSVLANVLVLLGTSVAISKSVFSFLPFADNVYLSDVHWFSAYWLMIVVGVHLGINWARVMGLTRRTLALAPSSAPRRWTLRAAAALLCGCGVWSLCVLKVGTKLSFNYSLEFWDFTASVAPFFAHWLSVVALPATAAHYLFSVRSLSGTDMRRDPSLSGETS